FECGDMVRGHGPAFPVVKADQTNTTGYQKINIANVTPDKCIQITLNLSIEIVNVATANACDVARCGDIKIVDLRGTYRADGLAARICTCGSNAAGQQTTCANAADVVRLDVCIDRTTANGVD